jgi:hypothetical protein
MAEISKKQANKCSTVVRKYAVQEAKKGAKKGARATSKATKTAAKKGFSKLKSLFK